MPTIALSMIVKNGASTIRACLESVCGVVDQIVIADTGCTDQTCDIAREFGAVLVPFPWENHFANARNAALKPVTADWVLVLDADEELDEDARKRIPDLLKASNVGGYITPIRNYVPNKFTRAWDRIAVPNDNRHVRAKDAPAYVVHENCRFFRRHPEIFFVGRVHEAVEGPIQALGMKLLPAPFFIHHFGQMSSQQHKDDKALFYRDLLRLKTEEQPNDALAWIQLGLQEYECLGNAGEALRCLDRALILQPQASDAWIFKSMALLNLGQPQQALAALGNARKDGKGAALREQLCGDAFHYLEQLPEARAAYREALKLRQQDPILESKLGFVEVKLGQHKAGIAKLERAAKAAPALLEVHDRRVKAYVLVKDLNQAAVASEEFLSHIAHPKLFMRAASIRAQMQQWDRAAHILASGLEMFPASPELQLAAKEVSAKCSPASPAQNAQAASAGSNT
ncbi:MAG TPA: glycosyltransferase [Terriglobales bacterium]|jgi:tetratricopeptide (TPR) repeat protein